MTLAVKQGTTSAMINNNTRALWYSSITLHNQTFKNLQFYSFSNFHFSFTKGIHPGISEQIFPKSIWALFSSCWRSFATHPMTSSAVWWQVSLDNFDEIEKVKMVQQHCKQLIIFQWECGSVVSTWGKTEWQTSYMDASVFAVDQINW